MADFIWYGQWISGVSYSVNTFVKYNNIAYVSTNDVSPTSVPPPNALDGSWNVFIVGFNNINLTPTPTVTPTPTITQTTTPTPTPTPTQVVIINPILVGVDEYIEVGTNEYLIFT